MVPAGHVVAPGFIDMHFHNAGIPFGEKLALRDGVTTPMELEGGVYPVDEWYAARKRKCWANYGAFVGDARGSLGRAPVQDHPAGTQFVSLNRLERRGVFL